MKTKPDQGFSIAELLVVLAIIAVLAAIAIPNLKRAKIKHVEDEMVDEQKTVLTYGLASGNQPVGLNEGWYYFREPIGSNIATAVAAYVKEGSMKNLTPVPLIIYPAKGEDQQGLASVNKILALLVQSVGLTNGYFVNFKLNIVQQAEKSAPKN